ncbi:hypothetical protein NDI37_03715 [Funiculus sociatus GB2-A5]|uniref:Uncharacterized protein n=1 Tax=Funiculus sociatus GB2-A5 TaxID=2933946 RepID=A0ABV0JLL2_9CYAN|nr:MULTISPECIES: hypothetical protein [unclassified Trichocoleus]MBD1908448.1 hypothetical protein [Trichocoleus sp. FACHB-832]
MRSRFTLLIPITVNFGAKIMRDRTCVFLNFQRLSVDGNGIGFVSRLYLFRNISELVFYGLN